MKFVLLGFVLLSFFLQIKAQGFVDDKVTSAANIKVTVSNLGLIGNGFNGKFDLEGQPSCEFPVGSGIEHIFQGGLWLGCELGGATVAVSTGAADDSRGYATGSANFEYTAEVGSVLVERSSLFDSPLFRDNAISHQDMVSDFTDKYKIAPGTQTTIQSHDNPLHADIHFEAYNWNYSFANFFVILNYTIVNTGTEDWVNFSPGYWFDGVVRNINITPPGGSAFFNKGGNGYLDSLFAAYEFDATGDPGFTDSYVSLKFLGADYKGQFCHPSVDTIWKLKYNTWLFRSPDPTYYYPQDDQAKYGKLLAGLNDNPCWESTVAPCQSTSIRQTIHQPNNRSSLLSLTKFPRVVPGDTLQISFALVCAKKNGTGPASDDSDIQKSLLIKNLTWAQTTYNGEDVNFNGVLDSNEDRDGNGKITRFVLPSPPDVPKVKIVPEPGKINLYWAENSERSIDPISKLEDFEGYRIYKTSVGFDVVGIQNISDSLKLIAQYDKVNSLGYNTGLSSIRLAEPMYFSGDATPYYYHFVMEGVQDGWQHGVAVTAFDTGDPVNNLESLESAKLVSLKRVFAGMKSNPGFTNGDPFVYPNPYYARAAWEGASVLEEDRRLMFANLPPNAEVKIYTAAGDLVDQFTHHADSYSGNDIRWFKTYGNPEQQVFSGGEHGWDLLSADIQLIARGLYVFNVRDLDSGNDFRGKFIIIK